MFSITELETVLPNSSASDRFVWAEKIVSENIQLAELINYFLTTENKVLSRFMWLLSDVGSIAPNKLLHALPNLLLNLQSINILNIESTFANYWLIAGVPEVNESEVINLLFKWLSSNKMNMTTKSRSKLVLERLVKKYPDLANELQVLLEANMYRD